MSAAFWSTFLAVISLSVTVFSTRGWLKASYWTGLVIQLPWSVWDTATGNYGFLLMSAVFVILNVSGIRRLARIRAGAESVGA
jgi:amino acid transporter